MTTGRLPDVVRICAYCPNPCRGAVPESMDSNLETLLPSALSYLAVAVHDEYVRPDSAVAATLSDAHVAEICRPSCVYGFDIPAELRTFLTTFDPTDA